MHVKTYFSLIFILKVIFTDTSNVINDEKCLLTNKAGNLKSDAIKEKYMNENGFGVIRFLKVDWAMLVDIKNDHYLKNICLCFAKNFYSATSNTPLEISSIQVDLHYTYCTRFFTVKLWSNWQYYPMWCTPLVKCTAHDKIFFLAESKAWYKERKFRNVFIFELSENILSKIPQRNYYYTIEHPMGEFKAYYQKVDFTKYLDTFVLNIHEIGF